MLSFLMLKNKTMVCTSIEQSNRLVELGINPKTADMGWFKAYSLREEIYKPYIKGYKLENHQSDIPAWSIHKLIEIISIDVTFKNEFIVINNNTKMFNSSTNVYDNLIDVIEYLINDNKINSKFIL
jgi:hypothetical protein